MDLRPTPGRSQQLDTEKMTGTIPFDVIGKLPWTGADCFDVVASQVMGLVVANYRTWITNYGTLYANSIQLTEDHYAQMYHAVVNYSTIDRQPGAYQINWDQGVGSEHVTAGERIAGFAAGGEVCPNNAGVFHDGKEITGIDVPVAQDHFSITFRHPKGQLVWSYLWNIAALRGYPNSDEFLGFPAGSLRYMGGPKTQTDSEASAMYEFDYSPNVTNLVVGPVTVTSKLGFDALSPSYRHSVDANQQPTRKLIGIEVIRPRELKAYRPVFGW